MIKYLTHSEIDKQKWDKALESFHSGLIYASSWYLDLVSPGWSALVEGNYETIMPITFRRKFRISYIFPPPFTQQLGAFGNEIGENKILEFINAIPPRFRYIETNLNVTNGIAGEKYHITENLNHELTLNIPYSEIKKGYSSNILRNIKNAEEHLLEFTSALTVNEVIEIFRENRGAQLKKLNDTYYNLLKKLVEEASHQGSCFLYGVREKGHLLAGAVFFKFKNKFTYIFSGTSSLAREKGAMSYLIDRFISMHAGTDAVLDFEGSNDPNLARFYKSFGSAESVYLQLKINNLPFLIKWVKE